MLRYEYPKEMSIGRLVLELSLKPFHALDDASIDAVCVKLFEQWRPLAQYATSLAVLLWVADGSEILEYAGDLDEPFEWCKYLGIGNPQGEENRQPCELDEAVPPSEPGGFDLHTRPVLYMKDPPTMRFGDLKRIVASLKRVCGVMYGIPIEVGETFDPGPEFARSDFKYVRHPEIAQGSIMMNSDEFAKRKRINLWLHCGARLHAEKRHYAAFPDGIPEGLHFGRFLGEQFVALANDIGFDYIWLSNGFGYSLESWNWTGELFDGQRFNHEHTAEIREKIAEFWREFVDSTCVNGRTLRIETRGSNLSAGMDLSAHGSPIDLIYKQPIVAPPNSPWAALNYRFGLELAGYMSHIAELPERGYQMRYYIHDPWWHNSPWFDRYDRMPHDIYLPLSITRMDEHGKVTPPLGLAFLSADDSFGQLPCRVPIETIPHLLEGFHHFPDEPGLVTWVYPFNEYVRIALRDNHMEQMFMDDWLIENAIDEGLPLNTVVSDRVLAMSDLSVYKHTILMMPVPEAGSELEASLLRALDAGLTAILYGNPEFASSAIRSLIGVRNAKPISGTMNLTTELLLDHVCDGEVPDEFIHNALLSDGGLSSVWDDASSIRQLAEVFDANGERRAYASCNDNALNGKLSWVRCSFPHMPTNASLPHPLDRSRYLQVSSMLRAILREFHVDVRFTVETADTDKPVFFASRCDNAIWFTGYAKDITVKTQLNLPEGSPVCTGTDCIVSENGAEYSLPKWWRMECRVLIKQQRRSVVSVRQMTAEHPQLDRRICVIGLVDARVCFLAPKGATIYLTQNDINLTTKPNVKYRKQDNRCFTEPITGILYIRWAME
ncbi:hypothetical protein AGMMS49992_12680 [Clostridia bacterium]|nr:hypothetical protein AGMMS49992_12680 [Clostridia bacterium]